MKNLLKFLVLALIPISAAIAGIVIITHSNQPEVVHIAAGDIKGYQNLPEQWQVTASPHFKWQHGTGRTVYEIAGIVLFLFGSVIAWLFDISKKDNGNGKWLMFATWVAGFLLIFLYSSVNYYSSVWTRPVSTEVYEANKSDLNKIFE